MYRRFSELLISKLYLVWPIAMWMRLLPPPCDWQALFEIGILSCPVELLVDLCWVAVYFSIISWPSAEVLNFDVNSSCLLAGINKLINWATWTEDMHISEQSDTNATREDFRGDLLQQFSLPAWCTNHYWPYAHICVNTTKICCPRLTVCGHLCYVTM